MVEHLGKWSKCTFTWCFVSQLGCLDGSLVPSWTYRTLPTRDLLSTPYKVRAATLLENFNCNACLYLELTSLLFRRFIFLLRKSTCFYSIQAGTLPSYFHEGSFLFLDLVRAWVKIHQPFSGMSEGQSTLKGVYWFVVEPYPNTQFKGYRARKKKGV